MLGLNWGATTSERAAMMPCDELVGDGCTRADRAVTIAAPPATVFAWLCQLRVAPYSYDLLDNFGRRSPRRRDPGLCHLAVGQRFMTLFRLHSFVDDEQITLRAGRVAVTYALSPQDGETRLHTRVLFDGPRFLGNPMAAGDLVMMRKQLLTIKALAEREGAPRARRRRVADEDSRLFGGHYDYADSFEVDVPEADARTPEQAFRAALARGPSVARYVPVVPVVHQHILRFRLGPLDSADHLFGWQVVTSTPTVLRLEAAGPLLRGTIVGRKTDSSTLAFTTFVDYVRPVPARVIWTLVSPLHRLIAPHLLEWAAAPQEVSSVRT
jgi:hypothetical protein